MKVNIKKILAILSSAVLSVNLICGSICSAEEAVPAYADSVQSGTDMSVYGTDTFGNMLAAELQSAQDEQIENDGQNIFSIEMTGKTAAVEYDVIEDCTVVVGIYDESGTTMLASGNADLSAENSTAEVTIDITTMPQYYYIKAFLIDKVTMRPLCSVYENPMYTQEMQEFLAMTTDDFEANKVYNLDDDKTNNFAVFNDEVKVIPDNLSVRWKLYNESTGYYNVVIYSPDEISKSLKPGDIFSYKDAKGNYCIDKVAYIEDEEQWIKVYIKPDEELELENVFNFVKIDSSSCEPNTFLNGDSIAKASSTEEEDCLVVDKDRTLDAGITCGDPVDIGVGTEKYRLSYDFMDISLANYKNDDPFSAIETEANAKLSGSVSITLDGEAKFYLNGDNKYVEFRLNYDVCASVNISGSASAKIQLFDMRFYFVPGIVYLSLKPSLIFEFSANLEVTGNLTGTLGMQASEADGIKNISTAPQFNTQVKVSGKFYVGISLEPYLCVFADWIARAGMTAKVGAEISAKTQLYSSDTDKNYKHLCKPCLDGDVSAKFELSFSATFLNSEKLTLTIPVVDKTVKLFDYYYSKTFNEFALGECPHMEYKTIITVYDNTFNKINDAVITVDGKEISRNSYEASVFLKTGTHIFKAESPNYRTSTKSAEIKVVSDKPNEIMLIMYKKDYSGNGGIDNSNQGGNGGSGESVDPIVNIGIQKNRLSLGQHYSAYITENGDLYTWGYNSYGQLGDGTKTHRYTPLKIMSNVAQVSLGNTHSACITTTGDLYTWGDNQDGRLGDGTDTDKYAPVKIMSNISQVSLGGWYSACITTTGDLYTWGYNWYGQLGDGTRTDRYTPVKIMSNVAQVSLDDWHSACITTTGDLYAWGANQYGQLGDGTAISKKTPVKIMSNVAQVSLGYYYSACITTSGDLYTWGRNDEDQLGDGTTTDRYTPVKIMSNVAQVSLGGWHSACITITGDLYTWGYNCDGRLGDGTRTDRYVPVKILSNVSQVSLGSWHSACITTNGDLYTWGNNANGQLGDGTTTDRYTPTKITIPTATTAAMTAEKFYALSSQQFTGLLPNEVYNIYSMNSRTAEVPFGTDNLLYIDQKMSDSSGNLTVEINTDKNGIAPEIFVKAMNGVEISNAEITSVKQSGSSASIGWEAVEGADKYTVYTIRNGIFIKEADTNKLNYTVDGLIPETEYGFIVQAWVNGEYSVLDKSDAVYIIPVSENTGDETPKPKFTSVTPGVNSISLKWNAIDGATSYRVHYRLSGSGKWSYVNTKRTSLTLSNLTGGKKYDLLVRYSNGTALSSFTSADIVTATPLTAAVKPKFTSVTPGVNSISLKWNAIDGATSYRVHYRLSGSGKWSYVNTKRTSLTLSNLTGGKKYDLLVRYSNGTALSSFTSADIVTATPLTAAVKPKFTSVTPGVNSISLKWNAIEGATSYRVHYRLSGSGKWSYVNTKRTSLTLSNLTGGKKYDLVVRYSNGTALSSFTSADIVTATPIAASSKPLIYSAVPGTNSVVLRWNAVSGAKSYRVYYRVSGTAKWSYKNTTRNAMNLTGLTGGKTYEFVVRAYNGSTWTAYSSADIVKAAVKS